MNFGGNTTNKYIAGETIYKSLRYNLNLSSSTYSYSNSAGSNSVAYTGTNLDLVTNVDGTFYRIVDSKNNTDTTSVVLSDLKTINSSSLSRYDSVRTQFASMLEDNLIYGLKFKKSPSSSATITGENISISGTTYDKYAFIKSAINFSLSQSGYMTAVLGGYDSDISYQYTQYGFKLYEVTRNEDKSSINTFTEITSVWTNESGDIQYNLTDTTGYTKVYDSNWYNEVSNGDYGKIQHGTAYYVEIPLKVGDYCLGGADSSGAYNSAYLMYLDIGANGASSGGGTTPTYKIEGVRFVYLLNEAYDTLKDLYTFEIVRLATTNGAQIYFLMTSGGMYYYMDPTYDTANTQVNLTNNALSATTNDSSLKTNYGGTKQPPS